MRKSFAKIAATMLAIVTVVSAMPSSVNAANKVTVEDMFVSETNYAETIKETVIPYIDAIKETGYLTGENDISLYYEKYNLPEATKTIVISHGMGENLEKYDEMIYYYLNLGYSVYGMEHRGHSRSGRMGLDEYQVSVDSFDNYISDFKKFIDEVVLEESGDNKLYLYAHSMGGGIGTRFLEMYPEYFDAAILSSPMHGINTYVLPTWLAKLIANGYANGENANKYAIGNKPYDPEYNFSGGFACSEARYTRTWQIKLDNPELRMGGGSYKWLSECLSATTMITKEAEASKVEIPVLLFQGGKDKLVENKSHEKFAKYAKNCKIVSYANSKHELYSDVDEVLFDYLTNISSFLEEN